MMGQPNDTTAFSSQNDVKKDGASSLSSKTAVVSEKESAQREKTNTWLGKVAKRTQSLLNNTFEARMKRQMKRNDQERLDKVRQGSPVTMPNSVSRDDSSQKSSSTIAVPDESSESKKFMSNTRTQFRKARKARSVESKRLRAERQEFENKIVSLENPAGSQYRRTIPFERIEIKNPYSPHFLTYFKKDMYPPEQVQELRRRLQKRAEELEANGKTQLAKEWAQAEGSFISSQHKSWKQSGFRPEQFTIQ